MTVEDRRRELAALVAKRKEDEAYRWMVAQCNCGHTWNPIWMAADREKFPPGPVKQVAAGFGGVP